MLGSKSQKLMCPKEIYEKVERYRDDHTIKELRRKKTNREWCQSIKEWQKRLKVAHDEMAKSKLDVDVDQEDVAKYRQFTAVHIFAMKHLIECLEASNEEPPRNSKSRQDLLAHLWLRAYSIKVSYVPLGRCSLTVVLDLENAMQSPDFRRKEWSEGPGAPGKVQEDVMHGWHGVRNALLAG